MIYIDILHYILSSGKMLRIFSEKCAEPQTPPQTPPQTRERVCGGVYRLRVLLHR